MRKRKLFPHETKAAIEAEFDLETATSDGMDRGAPAIARELHPNGALPQLNDFDPLVFDQPGGLVNVFRQQTNVTNMQREASNGYTVICILEHCHITVPYRTILGVMCQQGCIIQ